MPKKDIYKAAPLLYRLPPGVDPEDDIATNPNYSVENFLRDYKFATGDTPNLTPDQLEQAKDEFIQIIQQKLLNHGPTPTNIVVPGTPTWDTSAPTPEKPIIDKYQKPGFEEGIVAAIKKLREEEQA